MHVPKSPPHLPYNEWRVLPIATLTSIATVIGSGILALPVTLYDTPVPVFLVLFTLSMVAQIAVVYTVVELMQRARKAQAADHSHRLRPPRYNATDPLHSAPTPPPPPLLPHHREVSLFTIANLYLPNPALRALYFVTTFLCFVTILVSYGLAGPQAVWQVASSGALHAVPPPVALLVMYWALGTAAVIFFVDQLLGVFGSFTVLKGVLFVGVVAIVAMLPPEAHVESLSSLFSSFSGWRSAAAPFLMSCVALGGLANTVPVTFKLLPPTATRAQIARYRTAIVIAVIMCYLLNVGWVLAVLQVVPRVAPPGQPSLTVAYQQGQISTVPLIDTLHQGNGVHGLVLRAIEAIVEMFIFVSTGVSFFVCAAGMKSFVDGGAVGLYDAFPILGRRLLAWVPKLVAYVLSFGPVLYIIVTNPNGFIEVLTRFTSFTVNLQAGGLLFVMLYYSRRMSGFWVARASEEDSGDDEVDTAEMGALEMWESKSEVESEGAGDEVLLSMSDGMARMWIVYGSLFFALACALAAMGPLLGIKLGGHE